MPATNSQYRENLVQPVSLERQSFAQVVRALPATLRKRGKKAHKHEKKIRARIELLIAEGRPRGAERLRRLYIHSYDAGYVAAFDANKRLPPGMRAKAKEVHEIAETMDLRQTQGTARCRAEPKPKGGFRPVMNFDLRARAAQLLLKRAVRPFLRIRPDQYAVENGGGPVEARRIVELAAQGYKWFIEADVRNCYASLNPAGVKELPGGNLRRMMEANALSRSVKVSLVKTKRKISSDDLSNLQQQVRSGIPQGSLFSPLVAEAAIAAVLDDAEQHPDWPDAVRLVCHADNIAVFSQIQADAEHAADILRVAFKRSRIGPLNLLCKNARSINQGFDFLGIRFITKRRHVHAEVSPAARSKRLKWLSATLQNGSMPRQQIKRRMQNWGKAMSLRKDGRPLTRAAQWANCVLASALVFPSAR